jgi:response regulator RpfG family c-di-GMP phosphodiesterase
VDEGWLVDRLEGEGLLPAGGLAAARARQRRDGGELAGHLYGVAGVDEIALLRAISTAHQTSYVTLDRLARARIASDVLARLPAAVAERLRLVPLAWDERARTLSLIGSNPQDSELDEARRVAQADEVRVFIALPQAIEAALRAFYRGDAQAFAAHLRRTATRPLGSGTRTTLPPGAARPRLAPSISPLADGSKVPLPPMDEPLLELEQPQRTQRGPAPLPPAPRPTERTRRLLDEPRATSELRAGQSSPAPPVAMEAYLETLKVLLSLAEMSAASWRQGHAADVTRHARRLGQRVGLAEPELSELSLAAYLHDVGKPDEPHLTLLGLAVAPDQRLLAERSWQAPIRLFESARLPPATVAALGALYERFDGAGLPRRRRGRDIPLPGRIIAVVDAYVDLTVNPFGAAGGHVADRDAALATLRRHKDSLFDGHLVEIFAQVVSGDDLRRRLLGERARVLLCDADAEATSMIELKLVADGCEVRVSRSSSEALRAMAQWTPDLVVSEVALAPADGFALLEEARRHERTHDIPFFFLSERAGESDLERAFTLGAVDYLSKPVAPDVLLYKVRRLVAERARTREGKTASKVAGSLAEMSLSDVIEVLAKGRKTGVLHLSTGPVVGDVVLDAGKIVHATCTPGIAGQDALFALLRLAGGEFVFKAGEASGARTIDASVEWLLLEGLRRLDETGP